MRHLKEGSYVEVVSLPDDTKVRGIMIPCSDKKMLILKQDSGYNVGLDKKKIKEVKVLKKNKAEIKVVGSRKIKHNKKLPVVSVLQVGGTIVSKIDYSSGGVIAKMDASEFVNMIPEVGGVVNLRYRKIADIMSEDVRFGHYNLIAKEILKEIKKGVKGVIVTHGTDTLHFTSAALGFILGGVGVPVLLIGAQRSGDRGSSDGVMNLVCATHFIVKSDFKGVGVCMHKNLDDDACVILPGVKCRKMHTSRRDAFKAVNAEVIAEVSRDGVVRIISRWNNEKAAKDVKLFKEGLKVGILRAHTNLFPENVSCFKDYKGLILEGTGLGHFPARSYDASSRINEKIGEEIKKLVDDGCVICLSSQCVFGRVNMNVYTPQRELVEMGVIGCEDMTTETAFVKLAWLLSNFKSEEARNMMTQNLRGEISERSEVEGDFL
ncbi:MAG: Glu-tRNA(Gln) amidotransferase subunit GatD [Nanoarchaeota archaeon]|nr:Glu-tRNA(Gln) amidotransferase subunit GatD [Nanoarchaeota archaeon]